MASATILFYFLTLLVHIIAELVPRAVHIKDQSFILSKSNETIVLAGPNVVVKGPPYLPYVSGNEICNDFVNIGCKGNGTCQTCFTFNEYDIAHIKQMGWNTIRLGVVWAGAQPNDTNNLDPDFVSNLQTVLQLCNDHNIHVILDNHDDQVGTAGCGNGTPLWFQLKAMNYYNITNGKTLTTEFPYSLTDQLNIRNVNGYDYCGDNDTSWEQYSSNSNYNLLNQCCVAMNAQNNRAFGYTTVSQSTMNYLIHKEQGREDFVRFWTLMAEAVMDYPAAIACELLNEPRTIYRNLLYQTWQDCAIAINNVIPDMAVSIADSGEGAMFSNNDSNTISKISINNPLYHNELFSSQTNEILLNNFKQNPTILQDIILSSDMIEWIKSSTTLFYAWHWYNHPSSPQEALENALSTMSEWNVPSFATEFMNCQIWNLTTNANISHCYWHYSSYCNTGPAFGNLSVPDETFGACILGWAAGNSNYTCND